MRYTEVLMPTTGQLLIICADRDGLDREVIGRLVAEPRNLPQSPIRYLEVVSLMVARTERRQGIGRELMRRCVVWARDAGYDRVSVEASAKPGHAAAPFYEACGFTARSIILDIEA